VIDVEKLLNEISADAPSGENLEYDAEFVEMSRAAEGKPEQQIGDSIVPGEEPDWRGVKSAATGLLGRTKDLRVGVLLTRALLHTDGFPGMCDGLAVLHGMVERFWETVHPQLDPDDDNDPTMRVNILVALCDADTVIRTVRETPLVSSKTLGRFSLRDFLVATGRMPAPSSMETPPETGSIDAAVLDSDLEALQATAAAVARSGELVRAIESTLTGKVGAAQAADFGDLSNLLKDAGRVVNDWLGRRGVAVAGGGAQEEGAAAGAGPGAAAPMTGAINSREDVIRVLDRICDYFSQHEPSSPIPILLRRAQNLVSKDFMEIIRDIAPDGLPQVETIRGAGRDDS